MMARLIAELREVKEAVTNWFIADDPYDDDIYDTPFYGSDVLEEDEDED